MKDITTFISGLIFVRGSNQLFRSNAISFLSSSMTDIQTRIFKYITWITSLHYTSFYCGGEIWLRLVILLLFYLFCTMCPMMPLFLNCPFLISSSVFSDVYLYIIYLKVHLQTFNYYDISLISILLIQSLHSIDTRLLKSQ